MTMKIQTAHCSFQGGRDYNEDKVICRSDNDTCAIVVADGLGGHGGGQVASELTANYLADTFMSEPKLYPQYINKLFQEANQQVLNAQTPFQRMRSTGVALFVSGDAAIWAHAGDSRLYRFRDGGIVFQTADHSVSQMAVFTGEITADEIRNHEDRNKVLRAFGEKGVFKPEVSEITPLEAGKNAFLLCTDGFWEFVMEDEMEEALKASASPDEWVELMLQKLEARAPSDIDNYSAAAVFINS
jgi:serine/threonine protein phosphatase PrpC